MTDTTDRLGRAIVWSTMALFALAVAWGLGHKAGERARGAEHAAEVASLQTAVAAMSDRLAGFKEWATLAGTGSWYGHFEDGNATANGEAFDRTGLTAAVPWPVPMNMFYTVVRADTGQSVTVWANDRIPKKWGRIVDLSEAAAKELGMTTRGIAHVTITPEI